MLLMGLREYTLLTGLKNPMASGRDFEYAMQKVEDALQEKVPQTQPEQRTARFVAVLCMAWPDGHHEFFRGEVEGQLILAPAWGHWFWL